MRAAGDTLAFSPPAAPDLDEPLRLPVAPEPPRRGAVPLVASAVPVLGAALLWLATGSTAMLWFAALGPAIAAASLVDGARAARAARRRSARESAAARRRVRAAVRARHEAERERMWRLQPDVRAMTDPARGMDDVWRVVDGRGDELVVGRGARRSEVRVDGGDGDPESAALAREAAVVDDAPITIPASAGIAVCAPAGPGRAVVRALALQACMVTGPDRLRIVPGSHARGEPWIAALPHATTRGPAGRQDLRRLALWEPGMPAVDADTVLARVEPGQAPPPGCGAVLTLTGADRGRLVHGATAVEVRIEGVSVEQATHLALALAARAEKTFAAPDPPIALAELLAAADAPGLCVPLGTEHGAPFEVDLVADGPHAVVAGVTGAGKSELLTTWITALCAHRTTREVTFLLADFKGGTAFDPLLTLPHVTGVITDLDADGARRSLQSLRAELKRREAALVAAGARGIEGTGLSRLVIVVDEYAALRAAHPDLEELFTDIAARGRALGMHLILGTQRASGTFRESLLANTPLRISLRVTDPADSRVLIGTDAAAALEADAGHRGMALVRRAADAAPHTVRIALSSPQLVAHTAARDRGPAPQPAWLPALGERLTLAEASSGTTTGIVLGIVDEPDRQRQAPVTLDGRERGLCVLGMAGSGRTSALATIHAQAAGAVWIGAEPETAWDRLTRLDEAGPAPGAVILVDDVDALLARYPLEYAQAAAERLERIVHAAAGTAAVVLSAQRAGGAVGRLADLLPRRAILAMPTRADLVAAGGAGHLWRDGAPPGRAVLDGRTMQFALPPAPPPHGTGPVPVWVPTAVTGAVLRPGPMPGALARAVDAAGAIVVAVDDAMPALTAASPGPLVIAGDGEQWQRGWRVLQAVRERGDLLIDAACPAEYRVLTGDRAVPPYCVPGRRRAWLIPAGGGTTRVQLPAGG